MNAIGDHRPDVEPRADQDGHLVPGLVHLPAVDPTQGQLVEDDLVDVERDLGGGQPEDRDAAAMGHVRDRRPKGDGVARHLERHVEPLDHPELGLDRSEIALPGVDGDRRAHLHRELAPERIRLGDDDEARARVPDHGGRHEPDRAGAGHEDVLAEDRE